jgi:hypothetical protein
MVSIISGCPHCRINLKVPEDLAGQPYLCPLCKQQLIVPGPPPAPPVAQDGHSPPAADAAESHYRAAPQEPGADRQR